MNVVAIGIVAEVEDKNVEKELIDVLGKLNVSESQKQAVTNMFKSANVKDDVTQDVGKLFDMLKKFPKNSHKKGEGKMAKTNAIIELSKKIDAELYKNPKLLAKIVANIAA